MEVWVERRDQTLSSGHQRVRVHSPLGATVSKPRRTVEVKAREPAVPFDLLTVPVSPEKKASAIDLSSGGLKSLRSILALDNEMITINNSP